MKFSLPLLLHIGIKEVFPKGSQQGSVGGSKFSNVIN
jgi:hypothetical protein